VNGPTTARSGVHSIYEAQARLAKADALVNLIDAQSTARGINPFERSGDLAKAVRGWNLGHWITLAHHAGVTVPSDVTVEIVARIYEHRAEALREVSCG
jgi:hypothetical protein